LVRTTLQIPKQSRGVKKVEFDLQFFRSEGWGQEQKMFFPCKTKTGFVDRILCFTVLSGSYRKTSMLSDTSEIEI